MRESQIANPSPSRPAIISAATTTIHATPAVTRNVVITCGMIAGSVETWFVLRLFGSPVSPWEALTIESLTLALRHFAFFVPGGIGVQEAGFVVFGHLLGLSADLSVALSLAKRLREIGFGLPALASWQGLEWRRLRRGPARIDRA